MSGGDWREGVSDASRAVADATPRSDFRGTPAESIGQVLHKLARAVGHVDRLTASGTHGDVARNHFQAEVRDAAALSLELLQESGRRQGHARRDPQDVVGELVRSRILAAKNLEDLGYTPPARHASAALGAAISAIAIALPTVPLDDEHLPELDHALESVVTHAIAGIALSA